MNEIWLHDQIAGLLDFALASVAEEGGFGWLDDEGQIDRSQERPLWLTCRMTHVAAIGTLLGHPGCREALDHGIEALRTVFHDDEYGGWYSQIDWESNPSDDTKAAYPHAFVILASSSAVAAGADALPLFQEALRVSTTRFWDENDRMVVEEWDRTFDHLDSYRGVNANMHTVEAYMAAADVLDALGEASAGEWRERGLDIAVRVLGEAQANDWRIPEHFDARWLPRLEYNRDQPRDPFRPYGATIGHSLEWVRLCLQLWASIPHAPSWMPDAAMALYDRGLTDGWAVDGHDGFVYTTDWNGAPIVHERMHWVVAEAIGASWALGRAGLVDTSADLDRWWTYANTYLIDHEHGSWHHELDRFNKPSSSVWKGKPDVYHALQATLLQSLPLTPSIVPALLSLREDGNYSVSVDDNNGPASAGPTSTQVEGTTSSLVVPSPGKRLRREAQSTPPCSDGKPQRDSPILRRWDGSPPGAAHGINTDADTDIDVDKTIESW